MGIVARRGAVDVPRAASRRDTNPALLDTRLEELRAAQLVVHDADGYSLGDGGRSLLMLLLPLDAWATRWAAGAE